MTNFFNALLSHFCHHLNFYRLLFLPLAIILGLLLQRSCILARAFLLLLFLLTAAVAIFPGYNTCLYASLPYFLTILVANCFIYLIVAHKKLEDKMTEIARQVACKTPEDLKNSRTDK